MATGSMPSSARIWAAAIGWVTYGSPVARSWPPWASTARSKARSTGPGRLRVVRATLAEQLAPQPGDGRWSPHARRAPRAPPGAARRGGRGAGPPRCGSCSTDIGRGSIAGAVRRRRRGTTRRARAAVSRCAASRAPRARSGPRPARPRAASWSGVEDRALVALAGEQDDVARAGPGEGRRDRRPPVGDQQEVVAAPAPGRLRALARSASRIAIGSSPRGSSSVATTSRQRSPATGPWMAALGRRRARPPTRTRRSARRRRPSRAGRAASRTSLERRPACARSPRRPRTAGRRRSRSIRPRTPRKPSRPARTAAGSRPEQLARGRRPPARCGR